MKNKKGFTLVELLAVIAILAILVIIALPNVLNMYKKAQKEMFLTEAKKVYSEAEKKYLLNSISGKTSKVINSENSSKLDMTGKKLQYCIILNNSGKVSDMKVSNGKWIASLGGNEKLEDLTIDDLEEGNLDDYECGEPATSESCFTYKTATEGKEDGVPIVTISDTNKCKTYLTSSLNVPNEAAITICDGKKYNKITIDTLVSDEEIPSDDYSNAGLNVEYVLIEKVEVVDTGKCKNYFLQEIGDESISEEVTNFCENNGTLGGLTISQAVIKGYISSFYYANLGLKVSYRPLDTVAIINKYDISCGTDVVIPSKIDGYIVVGIDANAFSSCLSRYSVVTDENYKLLDYDISDNYNVQKMEYCITERLTSVVLPNSLYYIGSGAFANNSLKELVIPSSVKYIGDNALAENLKIKVTNNSSVSNDVHMWADIFGTCAPGNVIVNGNIIEFFGNVC